MSIRSMRLVLAALPLLPVLAGPVRGADSFQAVHDLTATQYQRWFDRVRADGLRPVSVHGYDFGGQPLFAAVAAPKGAVDAWEARHDLSADAFRATGLALAGKGYRLTCLSGYLSGKTPRFAALWVRDRKPGRWEADVDLTLKEYQDRIKSLSRKGFRPDGVSGYADGTGSYRFAALFVEDGKTEWTARIDLTEAHYQKTFDASSCRGYRPISVTAYPTPAGVRFGVVFLKDKSEWVARHGLTSRQYQEEFDRQANAGYRPLIVTGYASGKKTSAEDFDRALRRYIKERSIPAATLAVSRDGKLLLARGYGFAEGRRRKRRRTRSSPWRYRRGYGFAESRRRTRADDPMRLASVSKPITAAAILSLIRTGKLSYDTRVFPLLGLVPLPGQKPDPRLNTITVRHLLEHRGGWDRDRAFDPMFRPLIIAKAAGKKGPAGPEDVIRYMMGQPLQFDPGSRSCYSNFGYCILGRVIEKVTGQPYVAYIRTRLLAPLKIESVELGHTLPGQRNRREPVYVDPGRGRNVMKPDSKELVPAPDGTFYLEAMDAHGGLIGSAPDLIRFLDAYWISGEPRRGGGQSWCFFGSLPGTFTMVLQCANGVNVVTLFNQRTDPSGLAYEKIQDVMRELAADLDGPRRHAAVWVKGE